MPEYSDSKYESLEKTLSAIGKSCFVNLYYYFKDTNLSNEELVRIILRDNPRSQSERQGYRIPRARHIFATHQELDALEMVIDSPRIDDTIKRKARKILKAERSTAEANMIDVIDEHQFNESIVVDPADLASAFEYDNTPKEPYETTLTTTIKNARRREVAVNALKHACFKCEYDNNHKTFIRKSNGTDYTEPHHLVPMSASKDFPNVNLDREQNVVSLCSHCHNLIHYGADYEVVLKALYEARKDLLKAVGIDLSYDELKKYYK